MDLRTGAAFWPTRDRQPPVYPRLEESARAEIVVIGAGITGAIVACELAESGVDVMVLDAHDVVTGSSAASTGLLLYDTDSSLEELIARFGPIDGLRAYTAGLAAIDRIESLCAR